MNLHEILEKHKLWLEGKEGGVRANLSRTNLSGANLYRADLSRADLSRTNLSGADLSRTNLSGANLSRTNLYCADLFCANLSGANLSRTNLYDADLSGADLSGADLYGADLYRAEGIIRVGPSLDGYEFFGVVRNGEVWIKAGCRWFTATKAREHWTKTRGGTDIGAERLRFVTFIEETLMTDRPSIQAKEQDNA